MKSPKLDCTEIHAQLALHVGGDLEEPQAGAVVAHLETCGECRAEAERLQAALRTLGVLRERTEPTIDVWSGVRAGLEREGLLRPTVSPVSPSAISSIVAGPAPQRAARAPAWRRHAALAAAAAAVVLVTWSAFRGGGTEELGLPGGSTPNGGAPQVPSVAVATPETTVEDALPVLESADSTAPGAGLRRALGEERLRDYASPFLKSSELRGARGREALASDLELR